MKKAIYISVVLSILIALIMISFVSAGIFDWFKSKITGEATSGSASINITVGVAPTITFVSVISATDPLEDGVRTIYFNFTASDADGNGGINPSTATGMFNKSGETSRTNSSCALSAFYGTTYANFSCNIGMQYFDSTGSWQINVTVKDNSSNIATNTTSSFTYNELTAVKMAPTALTWGSVAVTNTNMQSNNDPIRLNNTGNDNNTGLVILITGKDLWGETTTTQAIFAANYTVDETDACDAGPAMQNATNVTITGALLPKGNRSVNNGTSGQEDIYFCLEALNSDLSSQSYSTGISGAWVIAVAYAMFVIGSGIFRTEKNKKRIKDNRLVKTTKINKNMKNTIFLAMLMIVFSINLVNAFGIGASYWEGNPLKLPPGGSGDVDLRLQNMVGDEDITLMAELRGGSEIATITDPNLEYLVPAGTENVRVNLKIKIPENAKNGTLYKVTVYLEEVASGKGAGMVQMAQGMQKTFDVLVESPVSDVLVAPTEEGEPAEGISTQNLILIIALIILVIITIIFYILKRKKH